MRKLSIAALTALLALLALAGAAQAATVTVGDNFFSPTTKTVGAGTKLRFNWVGKRKHQIVKTRGPGGRIASPKTKADGVNLATRLVAPGTYKFICTIHPEEMRLTVKVR